MFCNKSYSNKIPQKFKRLKITSKFSDNKINKFLLLLRKGVYLYEYKADWEKFYKTLLPKKEDFYSNLNIEDVKDSDCNHAKRVCKDVKNFVSWFVS